MDFDHLQENIKINYRIQDQMSVIKMEHYKISKPLNDSTLSKFVIKNWTELNDLSSGQYSVNKKYKV